MSPLEMKGLVRGELKPSEALEA